MVSDLILLLLLLLPLWFAAGTHQDATAMAERAAPLCGEIPGMATGRVYRPAAAGAPCRRWR